MKAANGQKNRFHWHNVLVKIYEIFRWSDNSQVPKTPGLINSVTDPDLIDHAIFYMGATEKKYVYLLKRAREMGINIQTPTFKLG
jgi:hypothetical protein